MFKLDSEERFKLGTLVNLNGSIGLVIGTWDNVPALVGTVIENHHGADPITDDGMGYLILVDDTIERVFWGAQWSKRITEITGSSIAT